MDCQKHSTTSCSYCFFRKCNLGCHFTITTNCVGNWQFSSFFYFVKILIGNVLPQIDISCPSIKFRGPKFINFILSFFLYIAQCLASSPAMDSKMHLGLGNSCVNHRKNIGAYHVLVSQRLRLHSGFLCLSISDKHVPSAPRHNLR